jgi:predicted pPIWI-associating nuclease
LDILGGRYITEGVLFDQTTVLDIASELISYHVTGTVDVELHYGGRSDPVQIDETFPFVCTMAAKVNEPFKFLSDMTKMEVDTSSWHEDGEDEQSSKAQL